MTCYLAMTYKKPLPICTYIADKPYLYAERIAVSLEAISSDRIITIPAGYAFENYTIINGQFCLVFVDKRLIC